MATYKLTTIVTFTDNTCSEDPEDLQRYVDDIREDMLSNWDTADVTCDVDGKVYTSKGTGNRHEIGPSLFANHPWHQLKDELPAEGLHVLFHDGVDMHMGWITKKAPFVFVMLGDNWFVVLEESYDEPGFWNVENVSDWWWRKVEAPAAIKENK